MFQVRLFCAIAIITLLLAACSGTDSQTGEKNVTSAITLIAPQDGMALDVLFDFSVLDWEWDGDLGPDEYFDVRLWQPGEPHWGIAWTKDTEFIIYNYLRDKPFGEYEWSVAVIEGRDGQVIREIVPESMPYSFTITADRKQDIEQRIAEIAPGFEITGYSNVPDNPTTITTGPEDRLYVLTQQGDVYKLLDENRNGKAQAVPVYTDEADNFINAVGLVFLDGQAFVSEGGRINRLEDTDGDGQYDSSMVIADGFPSWRYWGHSNNSLAVGPDGKLYFPVGATTDHGPLDPTEPYEGTIIRMNPDGTDIEVFATGFRNPYDLVFAPNGDLFATDNNPDQFDEHLSFLPSEELNHVQEGLKYGFPDVFSPMPYPENVEPPVVDLTASVGSAGLTYYDADQFPEAFQDGIFVAQWGSNTLENSNGQRVIFVALERDNTGRYVGTWEEFLTFNPDNNGSHPVDVTVGPHGALYVAEYMSGFIYRVTYTGKTDENTSVDPINLGEAIYRKGVTGVPSCASCHLANGTGLGPVLNGIAVIGGQRVQGLSAPEYLRQSIVEPNAYIVEGYSPGVMFQDYGDALSEEQIDALITYLLTLD